MNSVTEVCVGIAKPLHGCYSFRQVAVSGARALLAGESFAKPMITIRASNERGGGDYGWLNTRHIFSFDQYHDPRWMGFRSLRVINEDWVAPGGGFPTHPHRDMEIITYVLEGGLAHKDSMGNGSIIRPGDGQRMSAGTGVRHSEANPSPKDPVHLLQIWITPDRRGHEPGYEQKSFPEHEKRGKLRLIASPDGADGSVTIHQDARLYVALLAPGQQVEHPEEGDGASTDDPKLLIKGTEETEVLLFDLT